MRVSTLVRRSASSQMEICTSKIAASSGPACSSTRWRTVRRRSTAWFSGVLQRLHNGILPTYLVWCLLGMIAMFAILFLR